jgi:ABC-type phosphate transport system substrate-binding protein
MFNKLALFAGSTAIALVSTANAFAADNIYPTAKISGNGASSVSAVITQELNCFGGPNNDLGFGSDGSTQNLPEHVYIPTSPTTGNPKYNCDSVVQSGINPSSVQDNVDGHYVSTGSGGGKNSWRNLNTAGIAINPFPAAFPTGRIQFAFSDSPISSGDLATYNSTAAPVAGAAIQVPMFVTPIAVAYSPVYGKVLTGSGVVPLSFKVKVPNADGSGGLRMKKSTYCGIFNGTITNWNDPALKADNGGVSLMDPADDVTRWNTTGVPIVLVGRSDGSGTTNIFTRALTAQCGGGYTAGGTDTLPAGVKSTAVYNQNTGLLTSGSEAAGKFGVVNGSDGVAATVGLTITDPTTVGQVNLNGRLGYVGADWVKPATISGSQLNSANLQVGTGTSFAAPTAANATLATKGILPPQSDSKGKYAPATPAVGSMPGLRTDPLAWAFPAAITLSGGAPNPLANPAAGYPITGTTNVLLYTCYASPAVRNAVQGFAMFHLGKVTIQDDLTKVPAKLVTSTAKGTDGLPLGIDPKNGIAPLSAQFVTGIVETFFTKVTTGNNPSSLNLWIQDKLQKNSTDVLSANPTCASLAGA